MKPTYRALSYAIAVLVLVQAAVIAFAMAGLSRWVANGGVLTQTALESGSGTFPESVGFIVHAVVGQMLIPLVALALLVVAFLAKIPGGVRRAAVLLGVVVLQVVLGLALHGLPWLGLLHGILALGIFAMAGDAGRRVGAAPDGEVARA